jgi:hypothetical protein
MQYHFCSSSKWIPLNVSQEGNASKKRSKVYVIKDTLLLFMYCLIYGRLPVGILKQHVQPLYCSLMTV